MPIPAAIGMMAAPIIGAGVDYLLQGHNNQVQLQQQAALQGLQIEGQKELTDYNQKKALEMWEKTNYEAQRKQMEKAGLNVGLMYKGAGQGGTTQVTPGSVTAGQAKGAEPIGANIGMGLQLAMQQAQVENIKANTEKTKVEAIKTAGVDTEAVTQNMAESKKRIENLEQDLREKKVTEKQAWIVLDNLQRQELLLQLDAQIKEKQLSQMDLDMEKTKAETIFKQFENEWIKAGVTTHDDPKLRMLIRILNEQGVHTFKDLTQAIKSIF